MCFKEPQELTKGRKAKQNKGTNGTRQRKEARGTQMCPDHRMQHCDSREIWGHTTSDKRCRKRLVQSFHKSAHVQELKNKTPREPLPRTGTMKATAHEDVAVQQTVPKLPDCRTSEEGNWRAPWLKKLTILEGV